MTISQLGNGGCRGLDLKLLKEHDCTAHVKDTEGCPCSMLFLICHLLLYYYNANMDRPLLASATGDFRRTMQRFTSTAPPSSPGMVSGLFCPTCSGKARPWTIRREEFILDVTENILDTFLDVFFRPCKHRQSEF